MSIKKKNVASLENIMPVPLILVVDSDLEARRTLCQFLENSGYGTAEAEDGESAIHQLSSLRPAMIILDADLSRMDGFKTCANIQKITSQRNTPVIMVIHQGSAELVDQAFAGGAEEYVTKPIHQIALGRLIRKTLERQAMVMALNGTTKKKERISLPAKKVVRKLGQANEALNVSEDKLRALVECSPDAIMVLDENGAILFINHPPPGYQDGNLKGKRLLDIIPEQSKPRFNRVIRRIFLKLNEESFLIEGPSSTWWKLRAVPLNKWENNAPQSAMIIVSDQTEKHYTESQAMRNARLATVGALAASVAHEVNNPNNAILLQASWLAKLWRICQIHVQENEEQYDNIRFDDQPFLESMKKGSEFLSDVINNSRRIGTIVSDLKRVTKPDSGAFRDDICIKDILDSALSILANQTHKYCDACFAQAERSLPKIHGNPQQLEQVFINLILNALQALPDRKRKVLVRAWYDKEIRKIAVVVEDEGVGIPEENIEKISLPFFTTKLPQGGTGLGLAICQSILAKHKSSLDIDSKPGRGTRVRVNFPIALHPSGETP
ncbi:MAG: response regulator [Magnetococcales bacterium]|nr:response regulator [Magnetococcales bacterium]